MMTGFKKKRLTWVFEPKILKKSLLKSNIDLKFIQIDVLKPGVARIYGIVLSADDETRIIEIVESVAGISSVQSKLVPMPAGLP